MKVNVFKPVNKDIIVVNNKHYRLLSVIPKNVFLGVLSRAESKEWALKTQKFCDVFNLQIESHTLADLKKRIQNGNATMMEITFEGDTYFLFLEPIGKKEDVVSTFYDKFYDKINIK